MIDSSMMPLFHKENLKRALFSEAADTRLEALEALINTDYDIMPVLRDVFQDAVTRWTFLGDLKIINPRLAELLEHSHAEGWVSVTSSGIQAAAR